MSPLSPGSPSGKLGATAFSAFREKSSTPKAKKSRASAPAPMELAEEPSQPSTPSEHKQLLKKLLSPARAARASPLVGAVKAPANSPKTAGGGKNKTEELLDNFVANFKRAVPPTDKNMNIRIAQFEEKEFLFVAEPSTQAPEQEEAPVVVTLNSIIAEDLDLKLPPSLLLEGTESEAEAEALLEAREKEVIIKTDMTRQLRAKGFETEEIVQALNALDGRLEALAAGDKADKMSSVAENAVEEFDASRKAFIESQHQDQSQPGAQQPTAEDEQPQPVDPALQAEVEKLQADYNRIFQTEQPRLFMNFLQRGSFDKERNNSDRRLISSCTFLDRLAMEEAAEKQAAQDAQADLQRQAEAEIQASQAKKGKKGKSTRKAKSKHQDALVGAVAEEEVEDSQPVVATAVDTDHLGLAETPMKFYVNKGKSVALEKTDGQNEKAKSESPKSSKKRGAAIPQAGISLVALGVRMSDAKPTNKPRVVSSHAYIIEGNQVGAMKKRANDLYHPLLLSTVSSPSGASSPSEGAH